MKAHLLIARVDHWFKNVFVLPGVVVAIAMGPGELPPGLGLRFLFGMLAVCLTASSNYVINELMDARFDRYHPEKRQRPVVSGRVNVSLAYVQWLALFAGGLFAGSLVSTPFVNTMIAFWVMGCVYNISPIRAKDVPYFDVLAESVNNPLRLLAGWYMVIATAVPPASLLLSYWMVGAYFMAVKRFAEYRFIADKMQAAAYRKSFAFYTAERLLVSVMFYGAAAMLFFGAFIMRYRIEMVLSFPLVAIIMATYLSLGLQTNSPVQYPERLYKQRDLMTAVAICALAMLVLLFVDLPLVHSIFAPSVPPQ